MFDLVIGLALVVVALVIGGAGGAYGRIWLSGKKLHRAQQDARRIVTDARTTEKEILLEAKEEAIRIKSAVEAENREHRVELQRQERRVARKEEEVTRKAEGLERRERNLNNKEKDRLRTSRRSSFRRWNGSPPFLSERPVSCFSSASRAR